MSRRAARWSFGLFMKVLIISLSLNQYSNAQDGLPLKVQADLLKAQHLAALETNDLAKILESLAQFDANNIPMPPVFRWNEVRAARSAKDFERAFLALQEYLKVATREDAGYAEALQLYSSLEEASNEQRLQRAVDKKVEQDMETFARAERYYNEGAFTAAHYTLYALRQQYAIQGIENLQAKIDEAIAKARVELPIKYLSELSVRHIPPATVPQVVLNAGATSSRNEQLTVEKSKRSIQIPSFNVIVLPLANHFVKDSQYCKQVFAFDYLGNDSFLSGTYYFKSDGNLSYESGRTNGIKSIGDFFQGGYYCLGPEQGYTVRVRMEWLNSAAGKKLRFPTFEELLAAYADGPLNIKQEIREIERLVALGSQGWGKLPAESADKTRFLRSDHCVAYESNLYEMIYADSRGLTGYGQYPNRYPRFYFLLNALAGVRAKARSEQKFEFTMRRTFADERDVSCTSPLLVLE